MGRERERVLQVPLEQIFIGIYIKKNEKSKHKLYLVKHMVMRPP
jgi:hypothetical protein